MFIQVKEGRQYSFLVELSSKDISEQQTEELITYFDASLHKKKEVLKNLEKENADIPLSIFQDGESGLKAITHYLKDEKKLSFSEIGKLLSRDQRTIWTSYNQAPHKKNKVKTKKNNKINIDDKNNYFINTSLFKERKLSILETITVHLLKKYSVKETSEILGKNQMTIWTVKRRAEKKLHRKIIPDEKMKGGQK